MRGKGRKARFTGFGVPNVKPSAKIFPETLWTFFESPNIVEYLGLSIPVQPEQLNLEEPTPILIYANTAITLGKLIGQAPECYPVN